MKRITVLLAMLICFNAWGADEWDKSDPAGSESPSDLDSLITTNNEVIDRLLKNYQEGAKISYASASTLTVATGEVVCSNSTGALRKFRSNTSAVTVIWGMIDTGAEASSTTYYLYAVADADATTFTVEISLSSSAPTGATYYARLGSFYNNSDSDIEQISNDNESLETSYILGQGTYYKIDTGSAAAAQGSPAVISFSFTFDAAPIVVTSVNEAGSQVDDHGNEAEVIAISTTGCTINSSRNTAATVYWAAIGQYKL